MLLDRVGICAPLRVKVAETGRVLLIPPSAVTLPAGMVLTQLPEPPLSTTSNSTSQEPDGGRLAPVMDTAVAPAAPLSTGLPPQVV